MVNILRKDLNFMVVLLTSDYINREWNIRELN